jgi:hypothetical protein
MRHFGRRAFAGMLASVWLVGCEGTTTEPLHSDVDLARRAWLAEGATSYSFQIATIGSWFPGEGYVRVQVDGGRVVAAVAADGVSPPVAPPPTLDELWDRLLEARDRGQLNSAEFDRRGVPIETDMGPWPVDGGVHYSVRGFTKVR